jgi:hypothetical protein
MGKGHSCAAHAIHFGQPTGPSADAPLALQAVFDEHRTMNRATLRVAVPMLASLDIGVTVRFYTESLGFTCRFQSPEYAIVQRDDI